MKKAALALIIFTMFLCGCKETEKETEKETVISSISEIQQEEPESVEVRDEEKTPDEPKTVTVEDFEEAKKYTIVDTYSDDLDSDYFFYGNFGESDAELFGRTDYEGYYVRIGDDIYPIDYYIGRSEPSYMIAADFDDDGNAEYGFDSNDGWGTGFYTEALIIVDPDETDPVSIFNRDIILNEENNLFEHVKTKVNESDGTLTYWFEDDGKELYKGSVNVNTEGRHITDEITCTGLTFGDIFTIEYEEDKWTFIAAGGTVWSDMSQPDYEKYVEMSATLTYKDGTISYENVFLYTQLYDKGESNISEGLAVPYKLADFERDTEIGTYHSDLTHDGTDDAVRVSYITTNDFDGNFTLSSFKNGSVGMIKVFDGTVTGSDAKDPIWTHTYAMAHTGNYQYFITTVDDIDYLVVSCLWKGQGLGTYRFDVLSFEGGEPHIVDFGEMSFESDFKEDTSGFFDSLYKWINSDSVLLMATDIDLDRVFYSTKNNILNPDVYYSKKR